MSDGERRLAAIMYTDIVGYTALTQRNESDTMRLLEEHRALIRPLFVSHRGREIKTIGDAFLVEFQSALDAVLCAVAIQQTMHDRKLATGDAPSLRIGVHIGDVIERGSDILGDAVNIASRIEPLSEPGGVCISSQVYEQVRNKSDLPFVSLGERSLKNVSAPVGVYKAQMPWEQRRAPDEEILSLPRDRIAVLPLVSMSPDPNDEYFADGMTEEVISTVSKVGGLEVISRTSVMQYKKAPRPIREVSRELGVGTVLEGSVRKAGNRLRVTVQMIDATRDRHVWAESYDRDIGDVFAIQGDIAKQVAGALQVKLLPDQTTSLERPPTTSVEAYELFLRGQSERGTYTSDYLRRAEKYYEQAILKDESFALAYAWLSLVVAQQGYLGMVLSKEAGQKARECARKALLINESLAEAHLVFGYALGTYDWDLPAAEAECRRAIELNPSLAVAHCILAYFKMCNRRFEEAIAGARRALTLDPFSSETNVIAGTIFLYSGLIDEAIAQFTRALVINPGDGFSRDNLGLSYVRKGEIDRGLQEMEKAGDSAIPGDLAYAYSRAGKVEDLKRLLSQLLEGVGKNPASSMAVASAYIGLGDPEKALDWLEKAFSDHVIYLNALNCDFVYDPLRSEPRFRTLLKKIGFSDDG